MKPRTTWRGKTRRQYASRRWRSWLLMLLLTVLLMINWGRVEAADEPKPAIENWQLLQN